MNNLQKRPKIDSSREKLGGVSYCSNHTGKMYGIQSVSTSPLLNPLCIKRAKNPKLICSKCFAVALFNFHTNNMPEAYEKNTIALTSRELLDNEIPVITAGKFRFEAFGDLINETQAKNYIKIARLNPQTDCALWTKNPHILHAVFQSGIKKPKNLRIVLSSPLIDTPRPIPAKYAYFIDKVFTVYSKSYLKEHKEVNINCGAKSCLTCGLCYKKNKVQNINEIMK